MFRTRKITLNRQSDLGFFVQSPDWIRIRTGPDFQIQCVLCGKQQNSDCAVRIALKRALRRPQHNANLIKHLHVHGVTAFINLVYAIAELMVLCLRGTVWLCLSECCRIILILSDDTARWRSRIFIVKWATPSTGSRHAQDYMAPTNARTEWRHQLDTLVQTARQISVAKSQSIKWVLSAF